MTIIYKLMGYFTQKWKFCDLITYPHVVPKPSFIFGGQIKIFLMKSESSLTLHRVTEMQVKCFMAQKGSKDIIKLVHVTSVVQP